MKLSEFNFQLRLLSVLLAIQVFTFSCTKTVASGSGSPGGGGDDPIPVPEDTLAPQSPDIVAPYVGKWRVIDNTIGDWTFVFLTDGRAAYVSDYHGKTVREIGRYRVEDGSLNITWYYSGHEDETMKLDEDGVLHYVVLYDLQNTVNPDRAIDAYNEIFQDIEADAQQYIGLFPIGAPDKNASSQYDPHPEKVIANATVATGEGLHFEDAFGSTQWYELPDHTINGYDGYSRADIWFLPNGRFCEELWVWDSVDPIHDESTVKHTISWGKYNIKPGSNIVTGDDVVLIYDSGRAELVKMVNGRRNLPTKNISFHNAKAK